MSLGPDRAVADILRELFIFLGCRAINHLSIDAALRWSGVYRACCRLYRGGPSHRLHLLRRWATPRPRDIVHRPSPGGEISAPSICIVVVMLTIDITGGTLSCCGDIAQLSCRLRHFACGRHRSNTSASRGVSCDSCHGCVVPFSWAASPDQFIVLNGDIVNIAILIIINMIPGSVFSYSTFAKQQDVYGK